MKNSLNNCIYLLLSTLIVFSSFATLVTAQEPAEPKFEAPAIDEVIMQPVLANHQQIDWIDSWIFGGINTDAAFNRVKTQIEQRIAKIANQCKLDEDQRAIVELACEGDLERFFRRVASVKRQLAGKQLDNNNMREFSEIVSPLQMTWSEGLFNPRSLFAKSLLTQLSQEQKEALMGEGRREQQVRNALKCKQFIVTIENSVPLTDSQRMRLLQLLQTKTPTHVRNHAFETYTGIYAASKIERGEIEPFLSADQIKTFEDLQKHWKSNLGFIDSMVPKGEASPMQELLDALR